MKSQFPNSAIRMEFSNSKPEDFSPEVRAWRAYAVEEVKKVLIPIQMCETEAQPIFFASIGEVVGYQLRQHMSGGEGGANK